MSISAHLTVFCYVLADKVWSAEKQNKIIIKKKPFVIYNFVSGR